ncbi:hypothetical protein P8452_74429 [Trifolium repens]|nr:hypothetical protein P8452_74429 [Trifolium repens]
MALAPTTKKGERRNLPQKKNKEGRRTKWRTKQREQEKEEDPSKKNYMVLYKHTILILSKIRDFKIAKDEADISYYAGYDHLSCLE